MPCRLGLGAPPTSSSWLGVELDLLVRYQLDVHTSLAGGYSHFFAGRSVAEAGRRDIDFGYLIFT
jgi:Alginate export